uniref:BZIP domain-containing protein n=1 Tax=Fagus sylvatica TaxID=28930 RepID=A0A2N9FPG4_FAGSY
MASSKVVTTNTDLPRQSSICSLSTILADLQQQQQQQQSSSSSKSLITSMSMDDLLKNLYSSSEQTCQMPDGQFAEGNSSISRQGSFSLPKDLGEKTVDEPSTATGGGDDVRGFLDEGRGSEGGGRESRCDGSGGGCGGGGGYGGVNGQFPMQGGVEVGFDGRMVVGGGGGSAVPVSVAVGGGRGKRRAIEEPLLDKATQQKQRRMIKNRESAARSRERKQAYTVELESLVTQLEEENARLIREEVCF